MKNDAKAEEKAAAHDAEINAFLWFFGALDVATAAALLLVLMHANAAYAAEGAPTASDVKDAVDKWEALVKAAEAFHAAAWPIAGFFVTHLVANVPGLTKLPYLGQALNLLAGNYRFAKNAE